MLSLFFTLFLAHDTAVWKIERTGLFFPIGSEEVVVSDKGEVYILDYNNAFVKHFDAQGKPKGQIASKGNGPGELIYPTYMRVTGDILYIKEDKNSVVNLYNADSGEYLRRVRVPRNSTVTKVKDGWIYGIWAGVEKRDRPFPIYWVDSDFKNKKELVQLKSGGSPGGVRMHGGHVEYSPLYNSPQMAANSDGTRAYVTEPDSFTIHVIDPAEQKVIASIRRDDKPIPMDEDWVAEKTKAMKEKRARMGMHSPFETKVPEFFPPIRYLIMDPNDNLVVTKWRGRPDQKRELVFMDPGGKSIEPTVTWDQLIRVMKIVDGKWAYVTFFDPGLDEAGIAKVKVKDIKDFISHNPIFFSGSQTQTIVR